MDKNLVLLKGKMFIDKCFNQQFIPNQIQIDSKPVLSVIIPLYNCEKSINASLNSIRNQNMSNFEIILINDYSQDKTHNIIKNFQENDERIKIIENKKNMGTLYSRSIGVLISKGEYIFNLDDDDLFFSFDVFDEIIKIAKIFDYDIIGYRAIAIEDYKYNIEQMKDLYNYEKYPKNLVVFQPQLSTWILTKKGHFFPHDVTIWSKCIKSKIYKEAIFRLGKKRYSIFVSWAEDTIANTIIFFIAQSFKFVHKYGIIHLNSNLTASFTQSSNMRLFGEIYLLDIIFDFSKNNNGRIIAIEGSYKIKNLINQFTDDKNLYYFQNLLKKFISSEYISNRIKNKIKKDFSKFLY